MKAEREFDGSVSSVGEARAFVADAFTNVPPTTVDDAVLITSELAANAAVHARTPFTIRVAQADSSLRIEVSDRGEGVPALKRPKADETFGRGLSIVNQLARKWGVEPQPGGGKTVWVEIAVVDSHGSAT